MKATDLMIGDWVDVYHELPDESGFYRPLQVTGIHSHDGVCFGHSVIECPWLDPEEFEESIRPIPLTPEILEKNGFIIDANVPVNKFWMLKHDKNVNGSVIFTHKVVDGGLPADKRSGYCCGPLGMVNLKNLLYVHELQHELRLCGIEKEIVL